MVKKCPVCGKFFKTTTQRQAYCSDECRYENKIVLKRARSIADIEGDKDYISEKELSMRPTKEDILTTVSLLRDFGVNDFNDMPNNFSSRYDLDHWRNHKIGQVFT